MLVTVDTSDPNTFIQPQGDDIVYQLTKIATYFVFMRVPRKKVDRNGLVKRSSRETRLKYTPEERIY